MKKSHFTTFCVILRGKPREALKALNASQVETNSRCLSCKVSHSRRLRVELVITEENARGLAQFAESSFETIAKTFASLLRSRRQSKHGDHDEPPVY